MSPGVFLVFKIPGDEEELAQESEEKLLGSVGAEKRSILI